MSRAARPFLLWLTLLAVTPMAWGAGPEGSQAAPQYTFYLRGGSQIQTSAYWEEGTEYRLQRFGGVIGLNKSDVERIERTEPGAQAAPVPLPSPVPVSRETAGEPPPAPSSSVTAYAEEMIVWIRGWLGRLRAFRKPAAGLPLAMGGSSSGGGPLAGSARPPLVALMAVVLVVPIFLFGGKRLGSWLFSESRR